jgi:catechol 2,3-dioxygenase-like lactoylglutathione lyase family enzyme
VKAHGLTPILNVSSLDESFAWFAKLGWHKRWDWGEPPEFGAVGSGVCEIFLAQGFQGGRGVWMTVWVDDVDAVYEACQAQGIEVIREPRDEAWGVREIHVRHPDGHVFRVSRGINHDHDHPHDHDPLHGHDHDHPYDHDHDHDHPYDHDHPHDHA